MGFRQFGKYFGIVGLSLLTAVGGTTSYAHAQQNYKPAQTGKSDSVKDDRLLRRVIISYMAQMQKFLMLRPAKKLDLSNVFLSLVQLPQQVALSD